MCLQSKTGFAAGSKGSFLPSVFSQVTIPGPISICRRPTRSWIATGTSVRAAAKLATLSERRVLRWVAFNGFFPAVEEAQRKGQVVKDDPFGHPGQRDEAWFKREVAPKLDAFSLKEIAARRRAYRSRPARAFGPERECRIRGIGRRC